MARERSEQQRRRDGWPIRALILAVALGVAAAGFYIYRNAGDDTRPADGSLIVNINTATQEELDTVPGIGPTRALQIIANRPYATVDDLERVYGIVRQQVDEMRPHIKVEGETEKLIR